MIQTREINRTATLQLSKKLCERESKNMMKVSLNLKIIFLIIILTFVTGFTTTMFSITYYFNRFEKNLQGEIQTMDKTMTEKLYQASDIVNNLFDEKMKELELLDSIVANNSEVKELIFNNKLSDDEASYYRVAGKLEKSIFYDDMNVDIELVNGDGKIKGKTSRTFPSMYESDNSEKIKAILNSGAVSFGEIISTDDGLAMKAYHAVMQIGKYDLESQNRGAVILLKPLGDKFAETLKGVLNLDVEIYNNKNRVATSFYHNFEIDAVNPSEIFDELKKSQGKMIFKDVKVDDEKYRFGFSLIYNSINQPVGMIGIVISLKDLNNSITEYRNEAERLKAMMLLKFSIVGLTVMLIGSIIAYILSSTVIKSIKKIEAAVGKISNGDFSQKINIATGDEVESLASNINNMAEKLEQSFEKEKRWSQELEEKVAKRTREIETKNEELKCLDELKDEFLANTSHELRTPLNGIIGIAETLTDGSAGQLSDKVLKNLHIIISNGKKLALLINDILDFSKLKDNKNKFKYKMDKIDLKKSIENTAASFLPVAKEKKITIEIDIPNEYYIEYDENKLQQILNNIIDNSVKFTEKGKVNISALKNNGYYEISISDTGIGIPEDKFETIFNLFEQGDGSAERKYGGTGLGLSITKKIVELSGGTIKVNSRLGEGSTFVFTLPISGNIQNIIDTEKDMAAVIEAAQHYSIQSKEILYQSNDYEMIKGLGNILIVDDEDINLHVLENLLTFRGYSVTKAVNGEDALELVAGDNKKFDLIILDTMLPGISGFEVTTKIRELYTLLELPILLFTAMTRVEDLKKGFRCGANDFITKPVEKETLYARVNTLIKLKNEVAGRRDGDIDKKV